jgi:ketosteroid isomerase-like protein
MGHPSEDLVRRAYAAFSRGDLDALRGLFASDAIWHAGAQGQLSGDKQGVDEILRFFVQTAELTTGTFRVELHDVVANDEHAVSLQVASATREAGTLEARQVLVVHVRDGKIAEVWHFLEGGGAEDRFWSLTSGLHRRAMICTDDRAASSTREAGDSAWL